MRKSSASRVESRFPTDVQYDSLASPLKSVGHIAQATQETLIQEESGVLDGTTFKRRGLILPRRGTHVAAIGDLGVSAGKTTPVRAAIVRPTFPGSWRCHWLVVFPKGMVRRTTK